jgi:site-specific recombinase XerD
MLCKWADTEQIERLDHGTVRAFLYWGREERAWEARTFRNHLQYLRSFFAWCIKQRILKSNPTDGIEKPKLPQRLPRCLSRQDMQIILNRARWYPWRYKFEGVRNETILYLLVYTGLRLQEMLDLEIPDVNLANCEILVRQGKGQKDRIVPIHPRLSPILKFYLNERKKLHSVGKFFFTGAQSDHPMRGKDVRTICKKLSRDTRIHFTPHMLRHTCGRLLVEADVDVFKIKEILGHSSIATTMTYLSVSTENLKRAISDVRLL